MIHKVFQLCIKILLKLLAHIDRLYTLAFYPFEKDPTKILCDFQEKTSLVTQTKALEKIYKVAVIIPFKDRWDLTSECLKGLVKQKKNRIDLTIVLVNNNSTEEKTKDGIHDFLRQNEKINFLVLDYPIPFNFSYLNNEAARTLNKDVDYLWFLNNDISFLSEETLENYVNFASNSKNLGALGSTLLYPDQKTVQHSFLAPGIKIAGAHPLKGLSYHSKLLWFQKPRTVPGITGASLFIEKETFFSVNGFDERLAFSCQDLDLCLKLSKKGFKHWTLTQEVLIHHETKTRKACFHKEEIFYFYQKWAEELYEFYPNYSTWNENPTLKFIPFVYPWKLIFLNVLL